MILELFYVGMQISNVSSVNKNPSFCATRHTVVEAGNKVRCCVTDMFRDDFNFKDYVQKLRPLTENADKVTFIDAACSEGSETASLSASIKKFGGELFNKAVIIASDSYGYILDKAKTGVYNITDETLRRINMILGHYSECFSMVPATDSNYSVALKPHDDIMNKIQFKHTDLLGALDDLAPHYNQVLSRNVLPYPLKNDPAYVKKYLDTLADRLDTTCTVALGEFDNGYGIDKMLKERHFVEFCENVYTPKY